MPEPSLRLVANQYAPGEQHAEHDHTELQISLVLHGEVEERVGSASVRGGALSVVVKDPGVRHANDFGNRGAYLARLFAPRSSFADFVEATRATSWRWTHDPRVAKPFVRLIERAGCGEPAFAGDDADVVDLLASISARPATTRGAPPTWLREASAEMVEGWSPNLTVAAVARKAGVHPVYLARCIRRWHGVAAGDLLRAARLSHAVGALHATDAPVSKIAHETGFSDEAHLCRTVSAAVGKSPGRLRRLARAFAF